VKRRKRVIARIFDRAKKPWAALWRWARRPGDWQPRARRWAALQSWARDHQVLAQRGHDRRRFKKFLTARRIYGKKFRHLKNKHHHDSPPPDAGPLTVIDGKQVPSWMAPKIKEIRARGRWRGVIVSGYRTPAYSESLCRSMCGAPTCPGRCAGRYSNHACPPSGRGVAYEGAIDVSDYYTFAAEARAVGAPFHNALPNDPVHFSRNGN
jgi:hypothetical protein